MPDNVEIGRLNAIIDERDARIEELEKQLGIVNRVIDRNQPKPQVRPINPVVQPQVRPQV